MAILLMGDATDYRLPAIQLFTAPYQKDPACVPQPEVICDPPVAGCTPTAAVICPGMVNTTSLMMFGDETECILTKGKGKVKAPVRIRTVPVPATVTSDPPTAGTFCRLSYREIKDQLDFGWFKLSYIFMLFLKKLFSFLICKLLKYDSDCLLNWLTLPLN